MADLVYVVGSSGIHTPLDPGMAACLVDAGHARYVKSPVVEMVPVVPVPEAQEETVEVETVPVEAVVKTVPVDAPRGNASRDEFAAYATKLGIEFDEDASRDEIRALVASKE